MTPVIALGVLIVAMVMGIPIPLSFLVSAAFICLVGGYNPLMLFTYGFNNQNSIILLTIPLFILAGAIIDKGGIGEKLISGLQRKGKDASPNGLGITTILACAIFGAVSGSAAATCSCIGSIMTPRLKLMCRKVTQENLIDISLLFRENLQNGIDRLRNAAYTKSYQNNLI